MMLFVIPLSFFRQMTRQYLETRHNRLLMPNVHLLTFHHLPVLYDTTEPRQLNSVVK